MTPSVGRNATLPITVAAIISILIGILGAAQAHALGTFQSPYSGSLKNFSCQMSSAPPGQGGWPSAIHCTYYTNPVFAANFNAIIAAAWKSPAGVRLWQQTARDRAAGIDLCEKKFGRDYIVDRTNTYTKSFQKPVLFTRAAYNSSESLAGCLIASANMTAGNPWIQKTLKHNGKIYVGLNPAS